MFVIIHTRLVFVKIFLSCRGLGLSLRHLTEKDLPSLKLFFPFPRVMSQVFELFLKHFFIFFLTNDVNRCTLHSTSD